jgi:hypothetical protein
MKSARSGKSGKTVFTTKSKYAAQSKLVAAGSLAPIGMQMPDRAPLKENKVKKMLQETLGTETLIEKLLAVIERYDPLPGEEVDDWPLDAHPNDRLKRGLSYTKMTNEVNHRQLRGFAATGVVEPLKICGSGTGCHSVSKRWRRSDLDPLGPGPSLYMKMLKYLGFLFALFTLLSIPSFMIFGSGTQYDDHNVAVQKFLASTSLGNLDSGKELVPSSATAAKSRNLAGFMKIKCSEGKKIEELHQFGLAFGEETVLGTDNATRGTSANMTVKTVERCTYGSMEDLRREQQLEK